jgi:hypothetical protein
MKANCATEPVSSFGARGERLFTVESANRALVLVRKVVQEVVDGYGELMRLRSEQQGLGLAVGRQAQLDTLRDQIHQQANQLKRLEAELVGIGCELKDFRQGAIDFPAWHAGRKVRLCWKLGEPEVAWWHEIHAGFAGRRSVEATFGRGAEEPTAPGAGATESP